MELFTIVGARPQFVKAAALSREVKSLASNSVDITERIIHTGQHYDENMSQVFFDELGIPRPWKNLEVGSGPHGQQTGEIMARLESLVMEKRPDAIIVYGDTNSTLAAALVAAKLHIPLAHIEAGLRSFNRRMPEEVNRVLTDHVSNWLFCSSKGAADHLASEGISANVHVVGDIMLDALNFNRELAASTSTVLEQHDLASSGYSVATIHRAETTDERQVLSDVLQGLGSTQDTIVLPLHPRTKLRIEEHGLELPNNFKAVEPLSYLDMMQLVANCQRVFTDSGGLQKEAYWLEKPCITLRSETEWTELVDLGWNQVVGTSSDKIIEAATNSPSQLPRNPIYGDGTASKKILNIILQARD